MLWNFRKYVGLMAAVAFAVNAGVAGRADEKPADKPRIETSEDAQVAKAAESGGYWIGVRATPITDEALRSQLNLNDRLIVEAVVPDSPSSKAGLKPHDILLKFGESELATLADLIKSINENGDRESKLLILRGGQVTTLTIQPSDRPGDDVLDQLHQRVPRDHDANMLKLFQAMPDGLGHFRLRMLGPGIAAGTVHGFRHGKSDFPNGLSISVSKENDQPAKIVAKMHDKTYETNEDKLHELPEAIREPVQRLLSTPQVAVLSADAIKSLPALRPQVQEELKKAIESAKQQAEELRSRADGDAKTIRNRIEAHRSERAPVEELRKELQALRKEVEQLKENAKPK